MISVEQVGIIRRLFHAEHWKIGTIATELGLHPDTVRHALETDRFKRGPSKRPRVIDPYLDFINQTLEAHPRLRATRIYEMVRGRGYTGGIVQLRRVVATLRPVHREAFLRLINLPGEQAQADWAHFGEVQIGRARRRLSCFVLTLSYSRALWLEFFLDQTIESLILAHVHAFNDWTGVARTILYDNMKSVVVQRRGDLIQFHPRLLELCAHYHFGAHPCRPARGNEKGRVERAIRYIRESFFAARSFTTVEDLNRQARIWRDEVAHQRPWPSDPSRTVVSAFEEEKSRLLPLPAHPFDSDLMRVVRSGKTIYVRFDQNDYSIPPDAVGRSLTLLASVDSVRILDGTTELARHRRSYDRLARIEDSSHIEALLKQKQRALGSAPGTRLEQAVPDSRQLLDAAFSRGESIPRQIRMLTGLLDDYGAVELRAAISEALARQTPGASSVASATSPVTIPICAAANSTTIPARLCCASMKSDISLMTPAPPTFSTKSSTAATNALRCSLQPIERSRTGIASSLMLLVSLPCSTASLITPISRSLKGRVTESERAKKNRLAEDQKLDRMACSNA